MLSQSACVLIVCAYHGMLTYVGTLGNLLHACCRPDMLAYASVLRGRGKLALCMHITYEEGNCSGAVQQAVKVLASDEDALGPQYATSVGLCSRLSRS